MFHGTKHARLLLVEDDDDMRAALVTRLHTSTMMWSNVPIAWTCCAHCAISYFLTDAVGQDVDLVIRDTRMPGVVPMFVLLEELQQCEDCPPKILMTAFGDEQTQEQADRLGALALLDKPFDTEKLLQEVHEAFETSCHN